MIFEDFIIKFHELSPRTKEKTDHDDLHVNWSHSPSGLTQTPKKGHKGLGSTSLANPTTLHQPNHTLYNIMPTPTLNQPNTLSHPTSPQSTYPTTTTLHTPTTTTLHSTSSSTPPICLNRPPPYPHTVWLSQSYPHHSPYLPPTPNLLIIGAAIAQWLACWSCHPRITGLILRSSSLLDETINWGPISMT